VKYKVTAEGRSFEIEIDHEHLVWVDGRPLYVDLEQVGGLPVYSLVLEEGGYVVFVEGEQEEYQVEVRGQVYPVTVRGHRPRLTPRQAPCPDDSEGCLVISAPLAGHVIALPVTVGERVQVGQVAAVVESMKMKMELRVPQAGIVEQVHGQAGRDVGQGEALVTLQVE
jgi:biotin carboxyl carrier protein